MGPSVEAETSVRSEDESADTSCLRLRPFQKEAIRRALEMKRSTIKAPTGTGKTIIAISWLDRIDRESLIIVPTQALLFQSWIPKLEGFGFPSLGQYYAVAKRFGKITVTTYASAIARPNLLLDGAEAVVVDEIHHLGAQAALRRLLPRLKEKEYVLGLSSVPEREDKGHVPFLHEFPISYDLSLAEAFRNGYVSPIKVIDVPSQMAENERAKYDLFTKRIQDAFRFCGRDIRRWRNCYNPKRRQYVGRVGIGAIMARKKLLSDIASKKERVLEIVKDHPDEMVLLFSESIIAIEKTKAFLEANGVACKSFHAGVEPWERFRVLEEWGDRFNVLLSCRALEEGIDVKEVAVGILITNGKSKRQYIQRMGRIIRPLEGKEAKFYVVYCPDTVEETYSKTIAKLLKG